MSVVKGLMGLAGLIMSANGARVALGQLSEAAQPVPRMPRSNLGNLPASQVAPLVRKQAGLPDPPMRYKSGKVASLDERLTWIQKCVLIGIRDPYIIDLSRKIIGGRLHGKWLTPEYDNLAELKKVYEWVDTHIRYTSDTYGIDTFASPKRAIEMGAGDCDDFAAVTCALVLSIGIPAKLVVIQTKGSPTPNHIFAAAGLPRSGPTKWIGMDASTDKPFGWVAPVQTVAKAWEFKPLPG